VESKNKPLALSKVFIGWSGAASYATATALRTWLPKLISGVTVWMSSDIPQGKEWLSAIAERLRTTRVGVLCITGENVRSPWLLFEAGFLARSLDTRICPYVLDIGVDEVPAPLQRFQAATTSQKDTEGLVHSIDEALFGQLRAERAGELSTNFAARWPELETELLRIQRSDAISGLSLPELIRRSSTPMYITDSALVIRHCNEAMLSLLRLTRPALIGKSVDDLVNIFADLLVEGAEFRSQQLSMLARARKGLLPDALFAMDVTLRNLDGSRFSGPYHLSIHADQLTSSDGSSLLGTFVVLHLEKKHEMPPRVVRRARTRIR
jgi:PAS domain-containing protein